MEVGVGFGLVANVVLELDAEVEGAPPGLELEVEVEVEVGVALVAVAVPEGSGTAFFAGLLLTTSSSSSACSSAPFYTPIVSIALHHALARPRSCTHAHITSC